MILVTGASGANGREIVKQLAKRGGQVRALIRNPQKAHLIEAPGVEVVIGDFNIAKTLTEALKGTDKALLLSSANPRQVELQGNFIKAAQRSGVQHIVKFSALGASLQAPAAILRWHRQTEIQLEESGISFTHLQPNIFMQNMFRVAWTISKQGVFYDRVGDAKFSSVDVRDIASVAATVLTEEGHEGKAYEITGPEPLSFKEVANKLSSATGHKVSYVNISPEQYKQRLLAAKAPEWFADRVNEIYSYYSQGKGMTVTNVVADVAKKTPITFDQFARDFVQRFLPS